MFPHSVMLVCRAGYLGLLRHRRPRLPSVHSSFHALSGNLAPSKPETLKELFVAPISRSRQVLAYVGAATQIIFWGNLAQWASTGYATKNELFPGPKLLTTGRLENMK